MQVPGLAVRGHAARRPRMNLVGRAVLVALACMFHAATAGAQLRRDSTVDWLASANSDAERYLRTLQLVGSSPLYPWSLRAFSTDEMRALAPLDTLHPWGSSLGAPARGSRFRIIAPEVGAIFNSRFPYGSNDGPVWAGRGLTTTLSLGARAAYGPFDVIVAPQVFRAENADFPLGSNGLAGALAFADARYPTAIDNPQRFGATPYQRFDLGQSTARVTLLGATAGVSTANEFWGPAVAEPFLFSNNSAGFRHLFIGTARPLGFGGVAVHVRAIAGKLEQSDYAITDMVGRGRYLSGLIGVVTVRQLPGFEFGGGRLFHNIFADSTVTFRKVIRPVFQGLLKDQRVAALGTSSGDEPDNQIASLFARWVFPESGLEIYGEYGREDNAFNLRDLGEEPDHDVGVTVGFRKAWKRSLDRFIVLRSEIFNDRLSHLDPVRGESVPYIHSPITQGHTHLGQILGAPDLKGGGGQSVALETYTSRGHATLEYSHALRGQLLFVERRPGHSPFDVTHALSFEQTSFHGGLDFVRGVTAAYELNRDFTGNDVFNLRVTAALRAHW